MIKNDYGHLNAPYYLEKLKNGAEIYVIPRKSDTSNVTVLVSKGSYQNNNSAVKIPFGTAFYLSNVLFDEKFKKEQAKKNIMATNEVSYSYSTYTLTSNGEDLFPSLEEVMKRISAPSYKEEDVEAFRTLDEERIKKEENDPVLNLEKYCVKGLYFTSGIQNGIYPSSRQGTQIHASALKRFQQLYYTPSRIAIFFSGNVNPKEIIAKLKTLPFPAVSSFKEEEYKNEENYEKACEELLEVKGKNESYLSYGIKFPARKVIYDAFGEAMFYSYEMMVDLLFKKNPYFLSSIADLRSELLDAKLVEAGEDCYLLLSFRSESYAEVTNFMANYLSKLTKKISSSFYERVQSEYYAKNLGMLYSPYLLSMQYARCYPNHISYPSVVCHTLRLSYSAFKKLLEQIKTFPRACSIYKK